MTLPIPRQRASNPARLRTKLAIHLPRLSARRLRAGFAPPVLLPMKVDLSARRVVSRGSCLERIILTPGRRVSTLSSPVSPPTRSSTRRSLSTTTPSRSATAAGLVPISWCWIIRIRPSPSPDLLFISSYAEVMAGPGFGLVLLATISPWMSSTAYGHSGLITRMLFQAYQFEFRPIVLCPIPQLAHDHEPNETMLPIAARCQNEFRLSNKPQLPTNELTTLPWRTRC